MVTLQGLVNTVGQRLSPVTGAAQELYNRATGQQQQPVSQPVPVSDDRITQSRLAEMSRPGGDYVVPGKEPMVYRGGEGGAYWQAVVSAKTPIGQNRIPERPDVSSSNSEWAIPVDVHGNRLQNAYYNKRTGTISLMNVPSDKSNPRVVGDVYRGGVKDTKTTGEEGNLQKLSIDYYHNSGMVVENKVIRSSEGVANSPLAIPFKAVSGISKNPTIVKANEGIKSALTPSDDFQYTPSIPVEQASKRPDAALFLAGEAGGAAITGLGYKVADSSVFSKNTYGKAAVQGGAELAGMVAAGIPMAAAAVGGVAIGAAIDPAKTAESLKYGFTGGLQEQGDAIKTGFVGGTDKYGNEVQARPIQTAIVVGGSLLMIGAGAKSVGRSPIVRSIGDSITTTNRALMADTSGELGPRRINLSGRQEGTPTIHVEESTPDSTRLLQVNRDRVPEYAPGANIEVNRLAMAGESEVIRSPRNPGRGETDLVAEGRNLSRNPNIRSQNKPGSTELDLTNGKQQIVHIDLSNVGKTNTVKLLSINDMAVPEYGRGAKFEVVQERPRIAPSNDIPIARMTDKSMDWLDSEIRSQGKQLRSKTTLEETAEGTIERSINGPTGTRTRGKASVGGKGPVEKPISFASDSNLKNLMGTIKIEPMVKPGKTSTRGRLEISREPVAERNSGNMALVDRAVSEAATSEPLNARSNNMSGKLSVKELKQTHANYETVEALNRRTARSSKASFAAKREQIRAARNNAAQGSTSNTDVLPNTPTTPAVEVPAILTIPAIRVNSANLPATIGGVDTGVLPDTGSKNSDKSRDRERDRDKVVFPPFFKTRVQQKPEPIVDVPTPPIVIGARFERPRPPFDPIEDIIDDGRRKRRKLLKPGGEEPEEEKGRRAGFSDFRVLRNPVKTPEELNDIIGFGGGK